MFSPSSLHEEKEKQANAIKDKMKSFILFMAVIFIMLLYSYFSKSIYSLF